MATIAYKTNEQRAAEIVFDYINENQPDFDLPKFIGELRSLLIAEHQAAVRHPKDFTPEEWDFWHDIAMTAKGRF